MAFFGAFQILSLLVMVAVPVLAIWALLSAMGIGFDPIRRGARRARRDSSPAVCGVCGHAVGDSMASDTCSECGTKYLQGGIVTTATATRLGAPILLVVLIVAATCVMLGGFSVAFGVQLGQQAGMGGSSVFRITGNHAYGPIQSAYAGAPDYQFYIVIDLIGPDRTAQQHVEPMVEPRKGTLTLGLRGPDANPLSFDYDVETDSWSIPARGNVPAASGVNIESAVRELYRRGGVDSLWSESPEELADAITAANTMAGEGPTAAGVQTIAFTVVSDNKGLSGKGSSWGGANLGTTMHSEPAVIAAMVLGAMLPLVVFVVAIWLLVRLRRRALAGARPGA